jgi:hypothetical protein
MTVWGGRYILRLLWFKRLECAASPRFLGKLEMTKSGVKRFRMGWLLTPTAVPRSIHYVQDDVWGWLDNGQVILVDFVITPSQCERFLGKLLRAVASNGAK